MHACVSCVYGGHHQGQSSESVLCDSGSDAASSVACLKICCWVCCAGLRASWPGLVSCNACCTLSRACTRSRLLYRDGAEHFSTSTGTIHNDQTKTEAAAILRLLLLRACVAAAAQSQSPDDAGRCLVPERMACTCWMIVCRSWGRGSSSNSGAAATAAATAETCSASLLSQVRCEGQG